MRWVYTYHANPDLYQRRYSAIEVGKKYQAVNGAVVLKSHLGSTAIQATMAQEMGGIMFNQSLEATGDLNIITQRRWLFLLILMLMSTAGLVGSDVYLPVLPTIGHVLGRDSQAMQFTLGIYLLGLSIGQLIIGPLTDRFGRKRLLVIGMLVYFIASIFCAFSTTYSQMLMSRFIQALGACSGLIIGREIVGDLFNAQEAGKMFSTIFPFVGMSPAISPVIGGFIGYYFGWQATFLFVSVFAFAIAMLVFYYLPETMAEQNHQSLHPLKILSGYPKLLSNKKFIAYVSRNSF